MNNLISIRGSIAVGLGIGLLYLGWAFPAFTHDALPTAAQPDGWAYGWDCCSQMDCKRVADSEIEETPQGYLVKASGTLIPYDSKKLRDSKDQFYHLCTRGGKPDGEVICLYRAPRGS